MRFGADWRESAGPFTGAVLSLLRINWSLADGVNYLVWKTRSGLNINVNIVGTRDVIKLAKRDVRRWIWKRTAERHGNLVELAAWPPLIAPLVALLRKPDAQQLESGAQGISSGHCC